jgi:2,4-dienoyl-CoA reductase-like NADH-dependent reductase (Old Yellow Enzyme family)
MDRSHYRIFSEARLATLTVPNRLVRSATWDPCILGRRKMTQGVLELYDRLATGGVGMIISGGLPVTPKGLFEDFQKETVSYDDFRVEGFGDLARGVRAAGTGCKIVAQLENGSLSKGPSTVVSPIRRRVVEPFSVKEIHTIIDYFVEGIYRMREEGFEGVQLHAAHGAILSQFLSPYTNRRDDAYGGSVEKRSRIVRDIVCRARDKVGDFPILIKMNATDYIDGGTDIDTFRELAKEVERAGIDGIEVSGGMWDCLVRSEDELGFRPVPSPESHTRIRKPEKQSYFLKYAQSLDINIPVILVGGNRNIERLETIVSQGRVDFIALCRPLISEPDLPNRWREGRGGTGTDCISCNSCLYEMLVHPGKAEPGLVQCVLKNEANKVKEAQRWLSSWVRENLGG